MSKKDKKLEIGLSIAYAMMAWTYATEFSHETSISVRRLVILSREEQLKIVTMFKRPRSEEQG
jgi:hypothetical protein